MWLVTIIAGVALAVILDSQRVSKIYHEIGIGGAFVRLLRASSIAVPLTFVAMWLIDFLI